MTIPTVTDDLLREIEAMDLDSGAVMLSGEHCKSILAHIRQLEKDAVRYKKALRFYADPVRYHGPNQRLDGVDEFTSCGAAYLRDVTRDGGQIAIEAMQGD